MENNFVEGQYLKEGSEGQGGYESYGYYNESGEFIYYENNQLEVGGIGEEGINDEEKVVEVHTDQGVIRYQEMNINGQVLLIDYEGRVLNSEKLQGVRHSLFFSCITFLSFFSLFLSLSLSISLFVFDEKILLGRSKSMGRL